jgi:hypothetical protein
MMNLDLKTVDLTNYFFLFRSESFVSGRLSVDFSKFSIATNNVSL